MTLQASDAAVPETRRAHASASMKRVLKKKLKAVIDLVPWGSDLYERYWVYPRADNRMQGVFPDYESALGAAGGQARADYDRHNAKKSADKEQRIVDRYFQDSDYPALFWLSQVLQKDSTVLELGGSVGYAYYSFRQKLCFPDGLQWTIVELPEAVRLGRQIAAQRGESGLSFAESLAECDRCSVFLTAGTLQYMQACVADMIGGLRERPAHLVINRVPVSDGEEFWTIQNLGLNRVPYRIHSRRRLVDSLARLGYRLHDTWKKPRQVIIPFAPERTVEAYEGFYFQDTRLTA